jgi:predicted dinucleotide-binding enzyme
MSPRIQLYRHPEATPVGQSRTCVVIEQGPAWTISGWIGVLAISASIAVTVLLAQGPLARAAVTPAVAESVILTSLITVRPGRTKVRDRVIAEQVAVLGTGIMGAPMARSLLKAGFQVRVWNRTPDKARVLAADGADLAETPTDAVLEAAFVITMLTDTAAVLAVMGEAAESVPDGAVWLQTSMDTDAERVAGLAQDHGITFVNCPVLGTTETAKQGRLVVLASGPGDALDRAQPIFDAIGSKTVRLDPDAGVASRMKLVVNAWTVAIVESLRGQLGRAARWACSRTSARR